MIKKIAVVSAMTLALGLGSIGLADAAPAADCTGPTGQKLNATICEWQNQAAEQQKARTGSKDAPKLPWDKFVMCGIKGKLGTIPGDAWTQGLSFATGCLQGITP